MGNPRPPGHAHFGSASFAFSTWGFNTELTIWTGIVGLIANLIVATALTPLLALLPRGRDETSPADYEEAEAPPMSFGPGHAAGAACAGTRAQPICAA
jgi:hypothetical protein